MNASVHWHTPSLAVTGPRGEAIRQVEYLRKVAGEDVQALITRQQYDVAGRLVALGDPRLPTPNTTMVHRLDGMAVKTHNVDGGNDTVLPGPGGQLLHNWDANDNHWEMTYDPQLRLRAVTENGAANFETFRYLDASADPTHNLRGQMTALSDPSGTLALDSFGMHGQTLEETRTFKDGKTCTSRQVFSAVGALLQTTDAGGHRQQSTYDIAGQLVQVQLQLNGQAFKPVLKGADYNAAGQIIEQQLGNDVTNHWHYREADGRLLRQYAQKAAEPAIQDVGYEYDRVGNITRLSDYTYIPTFFRNQRVDGQRTFAYDTTYQLIRATGYSDAPPRDNPGRPQPTDPRDRRNYVETFEYDKGKNLTRLTHVRDGSSHTFEMFIDPDSNRGVRWKTGDPAPVFPEWFDRAGNQLALQRGQPMHWNSRNQLESLTLVEHASGPADQELYQYSQGVRVYKRLETHTRKVSHVEQVHYVGNLEIRSKSSGEELHRITVATGVGEVTCLHWVADKPPGIDADQMRYSLTDHLGSSVTELDQMARLISQQGYFTYGAIAWMVSENLVEVNYMFTYYSGKEMDRSGLYYHGVRYYAPWLWRWVSADPAGDEDGLNRYAFVSNNPLRFVDPSGGAKAESVIMLYSGFVSTLEGIAGQTLVQIDNIIHQKNIKRSLLANTVGEVATGIFGYEAGNIGGEQVGQFIPDVRHIASHSRVNRLPFIEGASGGNVGGDILGGLATPITGMGLTGALIPQTSTISVAAIDKAMGIPEAVNDIHGNWQSIKNELIHPALNSVLNPEFVMGRLVGAWISILGGAFNLFARAVEAEDIKNRLDPVKIGKIDAMLSEWKKAVEQRSAWAEAAFDALGTDTINPADHIPNVNPMTSRETLAPITRSGLRQQTGKTLDYINRMQKGMAWYKEMGTTDNQFLMRQRSARR